MAIFQYGNLGDTFEFPIAFNEAGSADDGGSYVCYVRLAGAAASAAPVYSPTPALLSHASYRDGAAYVSIPATTGNGFAGKNTYFVYGGYTSTANSYTPIGVLGGFYLDRTSEGYGSLLLSTTIATLTSQTSFTLTAGSGDNSAYAGCMAIITDATTATQKAVGMISAYTGSTKTVTLASDPAIFTMGATDYIEIVAAQSNVSMVNDVEITGDGSATPFNV